MLVSSAKHCNSCCVRPVLPTWISCENFKYLIYPSGSVFNFISASKTPICRVDLAQVRGVAGVKLEHVLVKHKFIVKLLCSILIMGWPCVTKPWSLLNSLRYPHQTGEVEPKINTMWLPRLVVSCPITSILHWYVKTWSTCCVVSLDKTLKFTLSSTFVSKALPLCEAHVFGNLTVNGYQNLLIIW